MLCHFAALCSVENNLHTMKRAGKLKKTSALVPLQCPGAASYCTTISTNNTWYRRVFFSWDVHQLRVLDSTCWSDGEIFLAGNLLGILQQTAMLRFCGRYLTLGLKLRQTMPNNLVQGFVDYLWKSFNNVPCKNILFLKKIVSWFWFGLLFFFLNTGQKVDGSYTL